MPTSSPAVILLGDINSCLKEEMMHYACLRKYKNNRHVKYQNNNIMKKKRHGRPLSRCSFPCRRNLSQILFTSADGGHLRKVKQKPRVILAVPAHSGDSVSFSITKKTSHSACIPREGLQKPTYLLSDAWMLWPFCKVLVPECH